MLQYVRSSLGRGLQFRVCVVLQLRACVDQERITLKMSLVLDVPTRWNSAYLILEITLKYQKAFEQLEERQAQFTCELVLGP